jgi:GT2 family glycosyltransferase
MRTSVVIACHTEKRWGLLQDAIASVLEQRVAAAEIIVVVDHNPVLHQRLVDASLPITVLHNRSERGASGARNTGAFAATSEIIAFLDDDARADPEWLAELVRPLHRADVVGTGGHVLAGWQGGEPRWFPDEFGWVVGVTHRGYAPADRRVRNVWAENMAVRRDVFAAVGGFRTGFGKLGDHSRPEDTDLCIRMSAAGGHWLYSPRAIVTHHVPPERASARFFVRRCYHEGRGKADLSRLLRTPADALSAERRYTLVVLPVGVLRNLGSGIVRPGSGGALRALAIIAGFLATVYGFVLGTAAARLRPVGPAEPHVAVVEVPAKPNDAASGPEGHHDPAA